MSLEVTGVSASLGALPVLHHVTFSLSHHETVALLGRNGMGKTTTLKALAGLVPLTGGSVSLDGHSLGEMAPYARRRLGLMYVPEDAGLFHSLSVEENLRIGCSGPISPVFTPFPELRALLHRKAGVLSGGERKILAFGRAWLSSAQWFLIDEPSLGLAPVVLKRLATAIDTLREKGGVLLVEQNIRLAEEVSSRYILLARGQVVEAGPTAQLRSSEAYRQSLLNLEGGQVVWQ